MGTKGVQFRFVTGLKRRIFRNARLRGSWDQNGKYSDLWTETPLTEAVGEDGCAVFTTTLQFDLTEAGKTFNWGVVLDGPQGANFWGIPTEAQDMNSAERYRQFHLQSDEAQQVETYYFTYTRRLGAHKCLIAGSLVAGIRFSVWAPNAKSVEVVFGHPDIGYIGNDGSGIDTSRLPILLHKLEHGIWKSAPQPGFAAFEGLPYMYRIVNAQGQTVYRTDIFSRRQIGRGSLDPANPTAAWPGTIDTLDGTKSCSLVVDVDTIRRDFSPLAGAVGRPPTLISIEDFWAHEFTPGLMVPTRVEDLIIYELHIGALGFGNPGPGTLPDAMAFLDHLTTLGVNAIELLPMSEFSGNLAWGYGDTHHFCIESSAGGPDQYRHFIRECHRRGIAVIQDVVYNHYDNDAERAQWAYDSTAPEQNSYYWYEGNSSDYLNSDGGYVDNGSSGFTPRFWEEVVRQQFISSAAFLIEEMHVDGLRVDLTQAIHRDNRLHANGSPVSSANVFGQKLLREWSRTLRMINPTVMLIAEDHSEWDAVTKPPAAGGLGFDATWYASFYHNLIGDSDMAGGAARLLKQAGLGGNEALRLDQFSEALKESSQDKIVYHESHDEAGNAGGSARTIVTAVNHAPLTGATRIAAESRSRLVFGLSLLSAGTPMFFMGEEIGAQKLYRYNDFLDHREDILGERNGSGAKMFRYYQEIITLSRRLRSVRSHNLAVLYHSNLDRVLVFKRWSGDEEVIVFASFNNIPFASGYVIQTDLLSIPNGGWKEIFSSDAAAYGGNNVGNAGAVIQSNNGRIEVNIPANGFVIFVKQ
jgi:1,4-alpha-glucan branching enzyme